MKIEESKEKEMPTRSKAVLVRRREPRKKDFFQGEVFFLLTRPLMGAFPHYVRDVLTKDSINSLLLRRLIWFSRLTAFERSRCCSL